MNLELFEFLLQVYYLTPSQTLPQAHTPALLQVLMSNPHLILSIEPSFVPSSVLSLYPSGIHKYYIPRYDPKPYPGFDTSDYISCSYSSFVNPSLVPNPVLSNVDCAHSILTCIHHQLTIDDSPTIEHHPGPEICSHFKQQLSSLMRPRC